MFRIRSVQGKVDDDGEEEAFFNEFEELIAIAYDLFDVDEVEKLSAAITDLNKSIDSCEAKIEDYRMNKLIEVFKKMQIEDDRQMKTPSYDFARAMIGDDKMEEELINDFRRLKIEDDKDEEKVEEMIKGIKALYITSKNELKAFVKQLNSTSDSILTSCTETTTNVSPVIEKSNGNKIMSLVME